LSPWLPPWELQSSQFESCSRSYVIFFKIRYDRKIHATFLAHLAHLYLIILIILGIQKWHYSLCNILPSNVISCLLGLFFSRRFFHKPSVCCFLNVGNQFSHLYETTDNSNLRECIEETGRENIADLFCVLFLSTLIVRSVGK
jgi:hypothetical protein